MWLLNIALVLVVTAVLLAATVDWWGPRVGRWLAYPASPHAADVIVVHGGGILRTIRGIALFHDGLAPALWHTGYASGEARTVGFVLQRNVPPSALTYLTTTSTWSDASAIVATVRQRGVHSVLIVTEWWHSRRALCALRQQMRPGEFTVYVEPVATGSVVPENWWRNGDLRGKVASELLKFCYYLLRYGMTPWNC